MKILEQVDKEERLTSEISKRRNQLSHEYGQIRLDIYACEEKWKLVKMCQKFLYQVSPISWRLEHDWLHRSESNHIIVQENIEQLFGRYITFEAVPSIDKLIGNI